MNSILTMESRFVNGRAFDFSSTVKDAVLHDFLLCASGDGKAMKIWDVSEWSLSGVEKCVGAVEMKTEEEEPLGVEFYSFEGKRMAVVTSRKGPLARCIQLGITENDYSVEPPAIRFEVLVEHHFRLSSDLLCKLSDYAAFRYKAA